MQDAIDAFFAGPYGPAPKRIRTEESNETSGRCHNCGWKSGDANPNCPDCGEYLPND